VFTRETSGVNEKWKIIKWSAAGDIRALNENIFSRAADNAMNSICLFPSGRYARALFFSRNRKCLRGRARISRAPHVFPFGRIRSARRDREERIEKVFRAFSRLLGGRIAPIEERENQVPVTARA